MRFRGLILVSCLVGLVFFASCPAVASVPVSRLLVKGTPIHGSNGVRIGPDGLLYVVSAVGSRIDVFNPRSGRLVHSWGVACC
ncbi:hypothetical protein JWJ90_04160 [Desulfobulbus rhabdoformis]|jgi:hypothetical protein|uniref:hypothetical protein n=1 Tax=Desulfobulbus rhabdoformis TaxID=34032 RepID=UPI001963883F|nr:hypothetical protein [Desulfobulbus rhabdoformis]MBM9613478.1 hypothetical protein [Desulfobulbus rhabdoformis]